MQADNCVHGIPRGFKGERCPHCDPAAPERAPEPTEPSREEPGECPSCGWQSGVHVAGCPAPVEEPALTFDPLAQVVVPGVVSSYGSEEPAPAEPTRRYLKEDGVTPEDRCIWHGETARCVLPFEHEGDHDFGNDDRDCCEQCGELLADRAERGCITGAGHPRQSWEPEVEPEAAEGERPEWCAICRGKAGGLMHTDTSLHGYHAYAARAAHPETVSGADERTPFTEAWEMLATMVEGNDRCPWCNRSHVIRPHDCTLTAWIERYRAAALRPASTEGRERQAEQYELAWLRRRWREPGWADVQEIVARAVLDVGSVETADLTSCYGESHYRRATPAPEPSEADRGREELVAAWQSVLDHTELTDRGRGYDVDSYAFEALRDAFDRWLRTRTGDV